MTEENSTDETQTATYGKYAIFLAVDFSLVVIELYLFVAFTYFLLKKNLAKKSNKNRSGNSFLSVIVFLVLIGAIKCSVVIYAFLAPKEQSDDHCDTIEKFYQGITTVGIFLLYAFYWARQYSLYKEPQLQMLVPKWMVTFSKYLIVPIMMFWVVGLVALILFGSVDDHVFLNGTNTCTFKNEIDANSIALYSSYGVIEAFSVCILYLFIYVLRKHQKELLLYDVTPTSDRRGLHSVIRNCTIAALVTMITDVLTILLDAFLPASLPQPVFLFLWDISFAINIICLLVCFMNWRKMVFPWCLKRVTSRLPQL